MLYNIEIPIYGQYIDDYLFEDFQPKATILNRLSKRPEINSWNDVEDYIDMHDMQLVTEEEFEND